MDEELVEILKIKIKHEKSLTFNPQQLQSIGLNAPLNPHGGQSQHPPFYNNAVFGWQGEDGLEAVHKVIAMLLKKEEKAATQGQ